MNSEINIFIAIIAVIFVFLFAVEKFSHQMQRIVGGRFKKTVHDVSSTPFKGLLTGTIITSIVQSSTAVTVMMVSLVHAGFIPFSQSIGIILGANIGTALSTQIVAFKILNLAPYVLLLGFLLTKIKSKYEKYGKPLFYFGMIVSCIFLISVLVEPLKTEPTFLMLLSKISNPFIGLIAGIALSTLFQSSTIAAALVILLAGRNLIEFAPAFGVILGSNIGTSTTALIASVVVNKDGKRTALAHFLFNFIGAIIFLPFIFPFSKLISIFNLSPAVSVSISHLIFNVIIALIFLPFTYHFAKIIQKIIK